jgi:hypothetical protein
MRFSNAALLMPQRSSSALRATRSSPEFPSNRGTAHEAGLSQSSSSADQWDELIVTANS